MKKKIIKQNNYAFIDSQNVNLSVRDQGWILDYRKLFVYLADKYKVTKSFLFIGFIPGNEKLYGFLKKCGYTLIFKPTVVSDTHETKGNVDAELVLHAVDQINNYDKAIIVTGDGDFHCLVEYLQKKAKFERLLIPNRYKYSSLLRKFMPWIEYITDLKEKLEYNKNERH